MIILIKFWIPRLHSRRKPIKDEPLKRFEIYNGVIKVVTNELLYVLEDKDYQVEKWSLQNAYIHVDNSLFNFVKEEIKNR